MTHTSSPSRYTTGDQVIHKSLGQGQVIDVQGDMLSIRFGNGEVKKFVGSIAPLQKVL